ncbi:hypothetical protein LEP1GSC133_2671 [Leptospira borgpetersenii serovar Pomona str. 200901868]|uniref:Uncharacterized protein n=1 Tax=Leptospira borgpetersenii serovar Pomona str. 200901868 TaxID=1192866 RepID=M6W5L3_LEPBO|nr:hypothetical protein LEP1GSC133_2671 [Leptospira borgpetersenii serovar Pomona str. 200901868]
MKLKIIGKRFDLECVPKPFDLIGILADCCNCSYVLGQTLIWHKPK